MNSIALTFSEKSVDYLTKLVTSQEKEALNKLFEVMESVIEVPYNFSTSVGIFIDLEDFFILYGNIIDWHEAKTITDKYFLEPCKITKIVMRSHFVEITIEI